MKRVGLYIPDLSKGGAERVVSRLSQILDGYYEVFVILNEDNIDYDVFCKVVNLNVPASKKMFKKVQLLLKRVRNLKRIKMKYQLDCVISFLTSANIVNGLAKTKHSSIILSVRNYSMLEKKKSKLSYIKNFLVKKLYKHADCVVPVSEELKNSLINNYDVPCHKIQTIYNPYSLEEINALSKEKIENIEHEEFLRTGNVFVTVGRLTYQKGHWHLLKAFSMILHDKNAKLLIIGSGENQEKIELLIKELNLEGKVLLAGYQKNPFKYIAKSYGYVLSSLFEGFPNALVEAMACGCPVISTDCKSGPREILFHNLDLQKEINNFEHADYGLIVPNLPMKEDWSIENKSKEVELLTEAMIILMDNTSIRNDFSKKGLIRAQMFNYDACREEYIKVIENGKR